MTDIMTSGEFTELLEKRRQAREAGKDTAELDRKLGKAVAEAIEAEEQKSVADRKRGVGGYVRL